MPVQGTHYKEDYRRTQREGQNVYALVSDPSQFISPDEFKQLKVSRESETSTNSSSTHSIDSKPRLFQAGNVLSKQDIDDLYMPYCAVLKDFFHYLDEGIWLRATQVDGVDIWGNMDDDEIAVVAKLTLRLGQKSPIAATVIRQAVDWHDYAQLAAIIAPRGKETRKVLREAPARPKKQRSLFRKANIA